MLTLVICLVVVALSGAAVLHISLADPTKRATARPERRRDRSAPPAPDPPPAENAEVDQTPTRRPSVADPPARAATEPRDPAPPPAVIEVHRARSVGLLVLLLTFLGAVLALVVAVAAVAAVRALRAALVG